jgi:hypothetical protein
MNMDRVTSEVTKSEFWKHGLPRHIAAIWQLVADLITVWPDTATAQDDFFTVPQTFLHTQGKDKAKIGYCNKKT